MYDATPWIGVDLDATLAAYSGWKGFREIGDPVPEMLSRVTCWRMQGKRVKIMTARVSRATAERNCHALGMTADEYLDEVRSVIRDWLKRHFNEVCWDLEITCEKDFAMVELWDDRAVQVIPNTGRRVDGCR